MIQDLDALEVKIPKTESLPARSFVTSHNDWLGISPFTNIAYTLWSSIQHA
jgi:hypothetical protein